MKKVLTILILALASATVLFGGLNKSERKLQKSSSINVISDIWMDANRMNGTMRNNGVWYYDYIAGDWGLEWPKGSGISPIYAGGQWVGAKVNGEAKIAGTQHSATEFQPGEIFDGVATNPRDAAYKWYVIEAGGVGDWDTWPKSQGAPVDAAGNPLLIGDKTAFSVYNDLAPHDLFSTNKLGVEIRQTVFAFNRADAMGDMTFFKWQIVNKSVNDWDSTYFTIWTDPDVGSGTDDLVGCDPTLGLGYCYNGTNEDQNYGSAPPATGIDFFQGPIVDEAGSSVSLPNGTVLNDKKMLKMTAFIYYNNDDTPQGNPKSGQDVWNYMTGFWRDSSPITTPDGSINPFMFDGDPETNTGWLDSDEADRRFMMTTGPFLMPKWVDTNANGLPDFGEPGVQEIVAGVIVARGTSNLNSVTKVKTNDELAQMAYDLNFVLAKAPAPPNAVASNPPNGTVISWGDRSELNEDGSPYESEDPIVVQAVGDTVIIDNTITVIDDASYNFYGYTVYQYSDQSGADPVVIAHWDNGGTANAEPYTDPRHLRLTVNKHNKVGTVGEPLINGKPYYFGVKAHGYLKYGAPVIFDSPATILTVIPQNVPGVRMSSTSGDTLVVTHTGTSGGSVEAYVVDPSKATGAAYKVTFNEDMTWNLIRGQADSLLKNQTNQRGDEAYTVMDGLLVKAMGPDPGIDLTYPGPYDPPDASHRGYSVTNAGNRWISWPTSWGLETMGGAFGNGFSFFGSDLQPADYVNVEIRFAGVDSWPQPDSSSEALMAVSKAQHPDRWSKAVCYTRPGYPVQTRLSDVPFVVWDIENNRQLKVAVVEETRPQFGNNNFIWDMGWQGSAGFLDVGTSNYGGREYVFILNDTYDEQYTNYINGTIDGTAGPVLYAGGWGKRGTNPYLKGPFTITIFASDVNTVNDVFSFTAPASVAPQVAFKKVDVEKINVVPNPYYGYHSGESDPYNRWVQFTYMPEKCTIRIFDLAGSLIRILEKNDATTTLMRWDLKNEYQLPVASGIYVYHVEVPGLGNKVGKIAIFTPNERLDSY